MDLVGLLASYAGRRLHFAYKALIGCRWAQCRTCRRSEQIWDVGVDSKIWIQAKMFWPQRIISFHYNLLLILFSVIQAVVHKRSDDQAGFKQILKLVWIRNNGPMWTSTTVYCVYTVFSAMKFYVSIKWFRSSALFTTSSHVSFPCWTKYQKLLENMTRK